MRNNTGEGLCNQATRYFVENKFLSLAMSTMRYSGSGKNEENIGNRKVGKNPENHGI